MIHDSLADMCTRIRNGQNNRLLEIQIIKTKLNINVLKLLYSEGYIRGFKYNKDNKYKINVFLKYYEDKPAIYHISKISKNSRRVYFSVSQLKPSFNNLGIYILSTSKGIVTDKFCKLNNLGGEILCKIF
jgi:small subunit ribosomal protein S8